MRSCGVKKDEKFVPGAKMSVKGTSGYITISCSLISWNILWWIYLIISNKRVWKNNFFNGSIIDKFRSKCTLQKQTHCKFNVFRISKGLEQFWNKDALLIYLISVSSSSNRSMYCFEFIQKITCCAFQLTRKITYAERSFIYSNFQLCLIGKIIKHPSLHTLCPFTLLLI